MIKSKISFLTAVILFSVPENVRKSEKRADAEKAAMTDNFVQMRLQ